MLLGLARAESVVVGVACWVQDLLLVAQSGLDLIGSGRGGQLLFHSPLLASGLEDDALKSIYFFLQLDDLRFYGFLFR